MIGKILAILLVVVVIGGVVYLYSSGIVTNAFRSVQNSGFFASSSSPFFPHLPSSTSYTPPPGGYTPPPPAYTPNGSTIGPAPTATYGGGAVSISPGQVPPGYTVSQLSPYFHQVRLGSVIPGNPLGSFYGSYGQISLTTSFYAPPPQQGSAPASIDVTGWQIKANRGGVYVPQAVNYYDPLGLAAPSDIRLKSGDVLYLYSSSAPVNLRINKCIGYLPNKSQFNPQLPVTCPYIDRAAIQSFSGACQNYIMSLGGCQAANLNDSRVPNEYSCRDYLANNFNYRACYDAHVVDANFLSNEVRVWTGSTPLDPFHDNVQLVDGNGLLVDYYTY